MKVCLVVPTTKPSFPLRPALDTLPPQSPPPLTHTQFLAQHSDVPCATLANVVPLTDNEAPYVHHQEVGKSTHTPPPVPGVILIVYSPAEEESLISNLILSSKPGGGFSVFL